jgi:hypothetical protein
LFHFYAGTVSSALPKTATTKKIIGLPVAFCTLLFWDFPPSVMNINVT